MRHPSSGRASFAVGIAVCLAACGGAAPTATGGLSLDPTEYAQPGVHEVTLTIEGTERAYSLLVPDSYDASTPTPLLLAFHGYTTDPNSMIYGEWGRLAQEKGFLVAAPAGLEREWAVARNAEEARQALPNSEVDLTTFPYGDRDVALAAAVLADVSEYLFVDQERVFATGVSLGGFMASRVACEIGGHFAGLGPTLNSLLYAGSCTADHRFAIVSVGHLSDATHAVADAREAALGWAEHNGCTAEPTESAPQDRITEVSFDGCPDDAPVRMLIHELGWPGDADERAVWEFFASLP